MKIKLENKIYECEKIKLEILPEPHESYSVLHFTGFSSGTPEVEYQFKLRDLNGLTWKDVKLKSFVIDNIMIDINRVLSDEDLLNVSSIELWRGFVKNSLILYFVRLLEDFPI